MGIQNKVNVLYYNVLIYLYSSYGQYIELLFFIKNHKAGQIWNTGLLVYTFRNWWSLQMTQSKIDPQF